MAAIPQLPVSRKPCSVTSRNATEILNPLSGPQTLTSFSAKYSDFVKGLTTQDTRAQNPEVFPCRLCDLRETKDWHAKSLGRKARGDWLYWRIIVPVATAPLTMLRIPGIITAGAPGMFSAIYA